MVWIYFVSSISSIHIQRRYAGGIQLSDNGIQLTGKIMTTTAHEDQFAPEPLDEMRKFAEQCEANNTPPNAKPTNRQWSDKWQEHQNRRAHNAVAGIYANISGNRGIE